MSFVHVFYIQNVYFTLLARLQIGADTSGLVLQTFIVFCCSLSLYSNICWSVYIHSVFIHKNGTSCVDVCFFVEGDICEVSVTHKDSKGVKLYM